MCVLIVKFKGVKLPSKSIINACCTANKDGFGYVTKDKYYRTTNREDFINSLYANVKTNDVALIHCRWATHGSVKETNCHPFVEGDLAFAHNGVLRIPSVNDMTDSEIAFRQVFLPQIEEAGLDNYKTMKIINNVRGDSRFAFLNRKTGTIHTFGNFESINGVLFSNTRWLPYVTKTTTKTSAKSSRFSIATTSRPRLSMLDDYAYEDKETMYNDLFSEF